MKLKFDRNEIAKLLERIADADKLVLVKDDGIYLMSFADKSPKGRVIVYAKGFDPRKEDVYDKAHDISGDDFSETLGDKKEFSEILEDSEGDICLNLTATRVSINYIPKITPGQRERRIILIKAWIERVKMLASVANLPLPERTQKMIRKAEKELKSLEVK